MTLSGTISAAQLNTDLDAETVNIRDNNTAGRKDFDLCLRVETLADTDDISVRSLPFTPDDDAEINLVAVRVTDGTASRVVTASLEVDNGDNTYLGLKTWTASATTVIGTADSRTSYLDPTGQRGRVLRGVRYRLVLTNTSVGTTVSGPVLAMLQCLSLRRAT